MEYCVDPIPNIIANAIVLLCTTETLGFCDMFPFSALVIPPVECFFFPLLDIHATDGVFWKHITNEIFIQ